MFDKPVDPAKWSPLIYNFRDYFPSAGNGAGQNIPRRGLGWLTLGLALPTRHRGLALERDLTLHRLGVARKAFAIRLEVVLLHYHRASIHKHGHRGCKGRSPILKLMYCVVMQIVQVF